MENVFFLSLYSSWTVLLKFSSTSLQSLQYSSSRVKGTRRVVRREHELFFLSLDFLQISSMFFVFLFFLINLLFVSLTSSLLLPLLFLLFHPSSSSSTLICSSRSTY
ncbi:unnamed protein product [Meloidogyne enterolobii]|uniref:Uncharacterized protein n=1 Tax=Meloidogyne enterolobii TaxID=390850 RepID=A0ACB1A429_MELEN